MYKMDDIVPNLHWVVLQALNLDKVAAPCLCLATHQPLSLAVDRKIHWQIALPSALKRFLIRCYSAV